LHVEAPRLKRDNLQTLSTYWSFKTYRQGIGRLRNAAVALDYELSRWEDEPDFKVLERSEVEISGVPAEQAIFTHKYLPRDIGVGRDTEELEFIIQREIYFVYDGLIWNVGEESNIDVAEAHKVHFEHMLETFKILD
ncbi:hypothetical protein ACFLYI_02040, partial [Chloroflexota bacterium]